MNRSTLHCPEHHQIGLRSPTPPLFPGSPFLGVPGGVFLSVGDQLLKFLGFCPQDELRHARHAHQIREQFLPEDLEVVVAEKEEGAAGTSTPELMAMSIQSDRGKEEDPKRGMSKSFGIQ